MTATAASVPNGPDTKNGYTFLYVNIPLLAVAICIVGFRVWWRCIKNSGGTLNKADVCVVICLVKGWDHGWFSGNSLTKNQIFNIIQVSCISVGKYYSVEQCWCRITAKGSTQPLLDGALGIMPLFSPQKSDTTRYYTFSYSSALWRTLSP